MEKVAAAAGAGDDKQLREARRLHALALLAPCSIDSHAEAVPPVPAASIKEALTLYHQVENIKGDCVV